MWDRVEVRLGRPDTRIGSRIASDRYAEIAFYALLDEFFCLTIKSWDCSSSIGIKFLRSADLGVVVAGPVIPPRR